MLDQPIDYLAHPPLFGLNQPAMKGNSNTKPKLAT